MKGALSNPSYLHEPPNKAKMSDALRAKRCFVISPIGVEGSATRQRSDKILRHVIKPVCADLGMKAFRADELPHASLISTAVMRELLTADVVVADLTGANPNVYYELAVRHFVGRAVVQFIEKGGKVPFDVSDINTIELDHTDLDSVEAAKERMKAVIENGINAPCHENPISTVLGELGISIQGLPIRRQSLVERFEEFSATILEELKSSRKERDLLWERLKKNPFKLATRKEPVSKAVQVAGEWESNFGKVRLLQDGRNIFGTYEYGVLGLVGALRGRVVKRTVLFRWRWTDHFLLSGVGYWKLRGNVLRGRWFYDREASLTLEDLTESPNYFEDIDITLTTSEEREWILKKETRAISRIGSRR
jgi:hypothetical protein